MHSSDILHGLITFLNINNVWIFAYIYRISLPALLKKCTSREFVAVHISFVFGIKTENYSVNRRIQSEYVKYGSEKTLYPDTSHGVYAAN